MRIAVRYRSFTVAARKVAARKSLLSRDCEGAVQYTGLWISLLFCAACTLAAQTLPPVYESTLPDGLTLVALEDSRVPMVTMRLVFPGGSRRDPKDLPGVAAAIADLLLQGTANQAASQFQESVAMLGASMNAVAGADQISIAGSVIAENLPGLLGLASEAAREAAFPELEMVLYRQSRKQGLPRQHAQPGYVVNEFFRAAIFGGHPYANTAATAVSIDRMSRQAVVDYRDKYFVPNNAFLILVGKLPARAQLLKLVTEQFSSWPRKPLADTPKTVVPTPNRRLILLDRPGATRAEIRLGAVVATPRDADYFPLIAASLVVGGEIAGYDEAGVFSMAAQPANEGVGDALQSMLERLGRISKEPVTARELSDARAAAIGRSLLRLEPQAGLADELTRFKILHLPADYIATYTVRMNAVTPDQVRQAAKKYLAPENDTIVMAGDASKLQPQLQKTGVFEIVRAK
jgi:zinc protease